MKTYVIGKPGETPRMLMTADEAQVALNVGAGEVYFSQANLPPAPNQISADGLSLIALETPLDDIKAAQWSDAKVYRDQKQSGGCATAKGRVDTDPDSQRKINGAVTAALVSKTVGQSFAVNWTMSDNSVVSHDAGEMIAMGMAVMAHLAACQGAGDEIRNEITAATSEEEVAAVDIASGYPA